jgi:hypothetical protein
MGKDAEAEQELYEELSDVEPDAKASGRNLWIIVELYRFPGGRLVYETVASGAITTYKRPQRAGQDPIAYIDVCYGPPSELEEMWRDVLEAISRPVGH